MHEVTADAIRALFQSLSGFPMSCNAGPGRDAGESSQVSIPIGFSNELQPAEEILPAAL